MENNILAVYLDIANNSKNDVSLISLNLKTSQNNLIGHLSEEDAYEALKKGWFGRATFWYFFGVYVGGPISAIHTSSVNKDIKADLINKRFNIGDIKPKESTRGFVWFKLLDNEQVRKELVLKVVLKKNNGLTEYNLTIPEFVKEAERKE